MTWVALCGYASLKQPKPQRGAGCDGFFGAAVVEQNLLWLQDCQRVG